MPQGHNGRFMSQETSSAHDMHLLLIEALKVLCLDAGCMAFIRHLARCFHWSYVLVNAAERMQGLKQEAAEDHGMLT